MNKPLKEGFSPYNLNRSNSLKGIDPSKICYFDTETTGLGPKSQIVEIAAMRGDEEFHKKILLTDETKDTIERESRSEPKGKNHKTVADLLQMTNYYDGKADSTEEDVLQEFKAFVEDGGTEYLLAHNAGFDMWMVNGRLKYYGLGPISKSIPVIDTLAFSRRFFIPAMVTLEKTSADEETKQRAKQILDKLTKKNAKDPSQRKGLQSNLGALFAALKGQIEGWHQAMADVRSAKAVSEEFFKLMDEHLTDDHNTDIRSNQTFKDYYMSNKRFEDRIKRR